MQASVVFGHNQSLSTLTRCGIKVGMLRAQTSRAQTSRDIAHLLPYSNQIVTALDE